MQIALVSMIVIAITRPLGGEMTFGLCRKADVDELDFADRRTRCLSVLRVDEREAQRWLTYAIAMLLFSGADFVRWYALQRPQWCLPFNAQGWTGVEQSLAFNIALASSLIALRAAPSKLYFSSNIK